MWFLNEFVCNRLVHSFVYVWIHVKQRIMFVDVLKGCTSCDDTSQWLSSHVVRHSRRALFWDFTSIETCSWWRSCSDKRFSMMIYSQSICVVVILHCWCFKMTYLSSQYDYAFVLCQGLDDDIFIIHKTCCCFECWISYDDLFYVQTVSMLFICRFWMMVS